MATSGSTSVTVTSYDTLIFSWSISSQSVANNTSTVAWKLQLVATSAGKISSSSSKSWSVTVNGTSYSGTNSIAISNNSTVTLASGSTTIAHNSDGTKSFSYSFSQQFSITFGGSSIGTKSGSGSGTLTTIARASTMTVPSLTCDGTTSGTFTITRASTSFTHKIQWSLDNSTFTDLATDLTTSLSYKPIAADWCPRCTNATSFTVYYRLYTYNGSTTIGYKTYSGTMSIPSSIVPSISSISVSNAESISSGLGMYVKGKSKAKFSISDSGIYGSTIASRVTTFNNETLNGSSATSSVINTTGTLTYTTTITDSRGRKASKSGTITVQDYISPTITTFTANRASNASTLSDEGTNLVIKLKTSITSLSSKNINTYKIESKRSSDTVWTTLFSGTGYEVDTSLYTGNASSTVSYHTDYPYQIKVTLTDSFGSVSSEISVGTAFVILDFHKDGKGIAIGKVAEGDGLDINVSTTFRKSAVITGDVSIEGATVIQGVDCITESEYDALIALLEEV